MSKNKKEEKEIINEDLNKEADTSDNADKTITNESTDEQTSETEKLKKELEDEKNKYLRLMAEYDNFRKRSAKEKLESYSDATAKAIMDILPVYDNFERALQSESTDENFKKGVEMIFNQFTDSLKKLGIEVIDPIGQKFDPNFAQAISQIEDDKLGENTVAQVFQKGYKLADKVIRYAMVIVANP